MNLIPALPLKVSKLIHDADFNPAPYGVVGNVTGNLTGKVIVNGCSWHNGPSPGSTMQDLGYVSIIAATNISSNTTTPYAIYRYIAYPYLGAFDFQPKPASPALTLTITIDGTPHPNIGGKLDVIAADDSTVLRTYEKYNDVGTFTFPIDLTNAYKLSFLAQGYTDTSVSVSTNALYVKLPYSESLVDEV